jgi:hypothetical protein
MFPPAPSGNVPRASSRVLSLAAAAGVCPKAGAVGNSFTIIDRKTSRSTVFSRRQTEFHPVMYSPMTSED